MAERIEIMGMTFGELTVIEFLEKKGREEIYLCKCTCGKTRKCRKNALLYENMNNCGCKNAKCGKKVIDLTGQRFGRWLVIERTENAKGGHLMWKCKCDCGTIRNQNGNMLKNGGSKSCGCLLREVSTKHGMYKSRLNKEYRGVKQRCYNPKNGRYEYYGGRGIQMCDEWLGENGFINFMEWSLKNGYTDELTLDKIDNDKNYGPTNCRWVDKKMQARNQRPRNTNKTGVVGVAFRKDQGKYRVTIDDNEGKRINLGQYDTIDEAKEIRKQAELKHWGWTKVI